MIGKYKTFSEFLEAFLPAFKKKSVQHNKAFWLLETTGMQDAADLKAELDAELKSLLSDPETFKMLQLFEEVEKDPITKREIQVLLHLFEPNQIPYDLIEKISQKEAFLAQSYAKFRPHFEGKALSENEIRSLLKTEGNPHRRKEIWKSSKEIGNVLAPIILELVHLRNKAAKSLGYNNYFEMQLKVQEVDPKELFALLKEMEEKSQRAYDEMIEHTKAVLREKYQTEQIGAWAFLEPFCQEDPLEHEGMDALVKEINIIEAVQSFYQKMGFEVGEILKRSDSFEREGKNQHAFCINMDREKDVRTLNNIQPSIKWLETVLHELGHAIYEEGFSKDLPWLLKEPPHMIPTEAMALLAGRQAYRKEALKELINKEITDFDPEEGLKRRQLIFSRWVLVMTEFEKGLYENPSQDLNKLWWSLCEKHQKIGPDMNRDGCSDWAAKYHIGLAPVYYFSYLLGEMFASSIQELFEKELLSKNLTQLKAKEILEQRLFALGNRYPWDQLIEKVTDKKLSCDAWVKEFAT